MYAVYHGAPGLLRIAQRVHELTRILHAQLQEMGYKVENQAYFDTLCINTSNVEGGTKTVIETAIKAGINFRVIDQHHVGVTFDESVQPNDLVDIINIFATASGSGAVAASSLPTPTPSAIPAAISRSSGFLPHPVFNTHHSETEMLRYIYHLQSKDLSLCHAMIPLGSCTMKLNSTSSMIPLSWKPFSSIHPFAPVEQAKGYTDMIKVCC